MFRFAFICFVTWVFSGLVASAAVPVPRLKPGVTVSAPVKTSAPVKAAPKTTAPKTTAPVVKTNPIVRRSSGARYFSNETPYPVLKPHVAAKQAVRRPVIVIDPGHGGKDPGAVGVKGTLEKTITSKAAAELAARLRRSGRYDVVVTRTRDVYVDHDDRLRVARSGQADLFISIHADSAGNKLARGASVYTLADRAKGRSRRIVNNQNWILDVDLSEQTDPVGDILVDLAQRKTESQSDAFAKILLSELKGKTALIGNSHRRAGYYVLLAPDVPAVLLELGFLSNAQDEDLLRSSSHISKILTAVERSIDRYMSQR